MRRATVLAAAVLTGCALLAAAAWLAPGPPEVPEIRAGAVLTLDRPGLAQVDLAAVHERLIPEWILATGGVEDLQFDRLRREAGRDRNLGALLDRMALLAEADPVLNARELLGLVETWNAYLSAAGEPWRLAGEIRVGGEGAQWRLKSYRIVLDDASAEVAGRSYRVEIRRRVDETTLVDTWLGHVHDHQDGVVVLLDAILSLSLDRVWPLLDPALDAELDPVMAGRATALRAEVARALPAPAVEALAATAEDRFWMLRAADAVHARHQCGSQFLIAKVPWNGMEARDLATLQLHADTAGTHPCPDVTGTEALLFAARSYHLRATSGLKDALERLVAWAAAAVAVHEARHAADVERLGGQPIPCLGCPEGTTPVVALEGSAYLASFASPDHGAVSWLQACGLDPAALPERTAIIRFLADRLTPGGCEGTPPADLAARARELEQAVFLRTEPVTLSGWPATLPVADP